jgi:3-oxoadipate enol-lactonase
MCRYCNGNDEVYSYTMNMKQSLFTYHNGHIYYEEQGTGEPIIFIHGFTLDSRMWQPQVDYFSQNYRVISYDARGFGKSSMPDQPYSHVDDLTALMQHLGIAKAHIVGLSMGGRIAINFALDHPEKVYSLALLDAALDGFKNTVDWDVHAHEVGVASAKVNWIHHDLFKETKNHPEAMKLLNPIVDDYSGWHWLHSDPQHPNSKRARERLHEIVAPTLILVGQKDLGYFHDIADVLATGISNCVCIDVPNAGHMVNLEAPETVNTLLTTFLEGK